MNEDQGPLASAKALHLFRRRPSPGRQSEKTKQKKPARHSSTLPPLPSPSPPPSTAAHQVVSSDPRGCLLQRWPPAAEAAAEAPGAANVMERRTE